MIKLRFIISIRFVRVIRVRVSWTIGRQADVLTNHMLFKCLSRSPSHYVSRSVGQQYWSTSRQLNTFFITMCECICNSFIVKGLYSVMNDGIYDCIFI